jgi:hypothetical protein
MSHPVVWYPVYITPVSVHPDGRGSGAQSLFVNESNIGPRSAASSALITKSVAGVFEFCHHPGTALQK